MPDDNFKTIVASHSLNLEALEERAGVLEYDADMSREAAEETAILQAIRQRDARRLVDLLFDPNDLIELRAFQLKGTPGAPVQKWMKARDFEKSLDWLGELNGRKYGCYYGVLPRRCEGGSKDSDAAPGRGIWADLDHMTPIEAKRRLRAFRQFTPAAVVNSGHGIHFYWRLNVPVEPDILSRAVARIADAVGGDKAVRNPSRVMRLPGFKNHKPPSAWCMLLSYRPERVVSLDALLFACPTEPTKAPKRNSRHWQNVSQATRQRMQAAMRYCARIPAVAEGARNAQAFKVASSALKDFALDAPAAWNILLTWNQRNRPPLPEEELTKVLDDADKYGKHERGRLARPGTA